MWHRLIVYAEETFRFKTIPSVEEPDSDSSTLFNVRRDFDYYNHPTGTWIEFQSKPLKEAMKEILSEMSDVSLDGKSPKVSVSRPMI